MSRQEKYEQFNINWHSDMKKIKLLKYARQEFRTNAPKKGAIEFTTFWGALLSSAVTKVGWAPGTVWSNNMNNSRHYSLVGSKEVPDGRLVVCASAHLDRTEGKQNHNIQLLEDVTDGQTKYYPKIWPKFLVGNCTCIRRPLSSARPHVSIVVPALGNYFKARSEMTRNCYSMLNLLYNVRAKAIFFTKSDHIRHQQNMN